MAFGDLGCYGGVIYVSLPCMASSLDQRGSGMTLKEIP
jgi:hypothetical protein